MDLSYKQNPLKTPKTSAFRVFFTNLALSYRNYRDEEEGNDWKGFIFYNREKSKMKDLKM